MILFKYTKTKSVGKENLNIGQYILTVDHSFGFEVHVDIAFAYRKMKVTIT